VAKIRFNCQVCGETLEVASSAAGQRAVCPSCNGLVVVPGRRIPEKPAGTTAAPPAGAAEAAKEMDYPERRNAFASTAGWAVSLALHALLFLTFTGFTWLSGFGTGSEGVGVGIAGVDEGPKIGPGEAKLDPIQAPTAKLAALQAQEPVKVDPITDIGLTEQPKAEAILGIDVGAAGTAAAMKGDWSAFVAAGGGGGGGGASFFGLEARGRSFVYVVDYSGSMYEMGRAKLRAAKSELIRSISALRRNMKFFVFFYDHAFVAMPGGQMLQATEQNKRRIFAWVEGANGGGGTDPRGPMLSALELKPDAVWLLSDGLFHDMACDAIRAANPGAKVQIHTIAFFDNAGEGVLRRIAEENRGHYRFVPPAALGLRGRRRWPRRP